MGALLGGGCVLFGALPSSSAFEVGWLSMGGESYIELREAGMYVPAADVYVDPRRPVERAVVSHGHADHAISGHGEVYATAETLAIMEVRYGVSSGGRRHAMAYGTCFELGGVRFTLVPAGHILGSAQVVMDFGDRRIVFSGDYKHAADATCRPFEVVSCDVFITEATFGLPVFRHPDVRVEVQKLLDSLEVFPERPHLVGVYALGKAQRLIHSLRALGYMEPIFLHGAMVKLCALYQDFGVELGELVPVGHLKAFPERCVVLAPPSALREKWSRRFKDPVLCAASGWMQLRQRARQSQVHLPMIVSDHADWEDLLATIDGTGAEEVWVTHGYEDALVYACEQRGLRARPLDLKGYGEDDV